jgi:hypothetical protein
VLGARHPSERLLRRDALGQVAGDRDPRRLCRQRHQLEADVDRDRPSIGTMEAHGLGPGVTGRAVQRRHRLPDPCSVLGGEVIGQGTRQELVHRPPELLDRAPVGVEDPAVLRIDEEDGVARGVEEPLEPDALAEEPGILDGDGGSCSEVLGEGDLIRFEKPAGLAVDQGRDARDPAAEQQWDRDRRPERQAAQQLAVTIVASRGVDLLGRDVRDVFGMTVPEDRGGAGRRLRVGRVVVRRLERHREQLRVPVGHRDPARQALLVRQLDDTPVGEGWHGEVGHPLDGLLVVEEASTSPARRGSLLFGGDAR